MSTKIAANSPTPQLPTATEWWPYLQQARAILEAAGATFRRGEDIAAEIEPRCRRRPAADAVDQPVTDGHPAFDHTVGEDDSGVFENHCHGLPIGQPGVAVDCAEPAGQVAYPEVVLAAASPGR